MTSLLARTVVVLATSVSMGCGDDGPMLECPGDQSNYLQVKIGGSPALALVASGGGSWEPLVGTAQNKYEACVGETYAVMVMCEPSGADGRRYAEEVRYRADERLEVVLGGCPAPGPAEVSVTGTMAQPGRVTLGPVGVAGFSSDWPIDLREPPGTYDLVVIDATASSGTIRRGVSIAKDTDLGIIDLSQDSVALVSVPVSVDGAMASDSTQLSSELQTAGDTEVLLTPPAPQSPSVNVFPASSLAEGDEQWLIASVSGEGFFRTRRIPASADPSTIVVPPRLESAMFIGATGTSASWSSLPDFTSLELTLLDDANLQRVIVSSGWLAEHPEQSIAFDTQVPGFDPAWEITAWRLRRLTVTNAPSSTTTGIDEVRNP